MDPRINPPTMLTFEQSCYQMAEVIQKMADDYGIPHAVGLDIVRMTMMFVVNDDTTKVTDALAPPAQERN
jgi:hypothetical protein